MKDTDDMDRVLPATSSVASQPGGSGPSFRPDIDPTALSGVPHLARQSFTIDPQLMESAGKYARGAVLFAFEAVGGAPALAQWAKVNQDDFYTKLFPRIITKEQEVRTLKTVDDLTEMLDQIEDAEIVEDMPVAPSATRPPSRSVPVYDPAVHSIPEDDGDA